MTTTKKFWLYAFAIIGTTFILFSSCEKEDPIELPTLSTLSVSEIAETTAKSGGNVTNDGGADINSRGLVWGTSSNPTLESHSGMSIEGSGTGIFNTTMSGLSPDTEYYVRAWASNSVGTAYGNEVNFSTLEEDDGVQEGDVINPTTGKIWMDRNLGASRAATNSTDAEAYGDLYQWGRAADGHEKRNSGTTTNLSSSNTPGHNNFILAPNSPYDWRSPQNDNLWQGVNGTNNPCPAGYRLPTEAEWDAERASWSSNNASGAIASPLKLPVAGVRRGSHGSLVNVGSIGYYWSSTVGGASSRYLAFFSSDAYMSSFNRADGYSVRCLKE